jgi:hypothetical protein
MGDGSESGVETPPSLQLDARSLVLVVLERFCDDRLTDGGAIRRHHLVRAAQRVGPIEILVIWITSPKPL